jgi:transposase
MSLHPHRRFTVPEDTVRAARQAFRRGNPYVRLRDALGPLFADSEFLALYAHQGQPALSPGCLATVSVLQYAERLSDRQAADAVRSRIDWKYLLGLSLEDPGFDASDLSDFRDRVLAGGAEAQLFTRLLEQFQAQGLLKQERQRTDSTHVLGAIRTLHRLELVGETMRAALDALAVAAPAWLRDHSQPDWIERYGPRVEEARLPKGREKRDQLAQTIGADGAALLAAIDTDAPTWLRALPAVCARSGSSSIAARERISSGAARGSCLPARSCCAPPTIPTCATARSGRPPPEGYKVHLTETCVPDAPNLITQVETTPATPTDDAATATIQADLADRQLTPTIHLVDAGYLDGELLASSQEAYGIDLCGPVVPDTSWQARAGAGFAVADFVLDWEQEEATCPQGKQSSSWRPTTDNRGQPCIQIHFRRADCQACPVRAQCTKGDRRSITVRPQRAHEARKRALQRQQTAAFQEQYAVRAGIESTHAQGVRRCDLRHARYRGLPKVRLQHLLIAAALNLVRVAAWLADEPRAPTRQSSYVRLMAHAA